MVQSLNTFVQGDRKGRITNGKESTAIINCKVDDAFVGTVAHGIAMKIVDTAGSITTVTPTTAIADDAFGFTTDDIINATRSAGDTIKVAVEGVVMIMEASAGIASGARVSFDPATGKVKTSVATNREVGLALDKTTADGDLLRVLINVPFGAIT